MARGATLLPSLLSTTAAAPVPNRLSPLSTDKQSIEEKFGNWAVVEAGLTGRKINVVRFEGRLAGSFSRLIIDLGFERPDYMIGVLTTPMGFRPRDGVRLQVDDGPISASIPFANLIRTGGIVRLNLESDMIDAFKAGKQLQIHGRKASNGEKLIFAVPLDGFAKAADRLTELKNKSTQ